MIPPRRMSALGRQVGSPPGAMWNMDRSYQAEVLKVNEAAPSLEVYVPAMNQILKAVRIKQVAPCNEKDSAEIFPVKGDIGIIRFLNGSREEPYWDGWFIQRKQASYKRSGRQGAYRVEHRSGVTLEMNKGKIGLGAGLEDLEDDDGVVRKKDLAKVVKFIMDSLLAWLKVHTHATAMGPTSPAIEGPAWLGSLEAEASETARAK